MVAPKNEVSVFGAERLLCYLYFGTGHLLAATDEKFCFFEFKVVNSYLASIKSLESSLVNINAISENEAEVV